MSLKVGSWLSQHIFQLDIVHAHFIKLITLRSLGYRARLFQEAFALWQSLRMWKAHPELRKQHALRSDRVSILLWRIIKIYMFYANTHLNPNNNGEIVFCGSILGNLEQTGILGWCKLAYGASAAKKTFGQPPINQHLLSSTQLSKKTGAPPTSKHEVSSFLKKTCQKHIHNWDHHNNSLPTFLGTPNSDVLFSSWRRYSFFPIRKKVSQHIKPQIPLETPRKETNMTLEHRHFRYRIHRFIHGGFSSDAVMLAFPTHPWNIPEIPKQ